MRCPLRQIVAAAALLIVPSGCRDAGAEPPRSTAQRHTLSVAGLGDGAGVVTSDPGTIRCTLVAGAASGVCSESLLAGSSVTLRAVSATGGHAFAGWAGACKGVSACQVSMTESKTVTAAFGAPLAYRAHGFNFGPYIDGQDPNMGSVVTESQVRERMLHIATHAEWIRGFGSTGGVEHVGPIGHELGRKTACGAWLGRNSAANDTEIAGLIEGARAGACDLLIVGSETLLRNDLTPTQLLGYITRVKSAVTGIPVSTADVHALLVSEAARPILSAVDVVLVNYYPFWEGIAFEDAIGTLHLWHQRVVAAAAGKEVIISETGWPSCGPQRGEARASPQNAADYLLNFVSWARTLQVKYFYFAALDESWKARYEGEWGACWGVFDKSGRMKPGMQRTFDGATVPDNWSGTVVVGGAGTPAITFTSVPPYGNLTELLRGEVRHVAPADYRVAVYIRVAGGWWTKPTFTEPRTLIAPSGKWVSDITTGGADQTATEIAAYLIPRSFDPPIASGQSTLPASLAANAIAGRSVTRQP